jgi:general stress protein 26
MDKQPQSDPDMQKLADLIGDASIAMLTTQEPDGALRSRPLATLQMDPEGKLWFFTAMSSAKVGEIDQHRHVNLSYANPEKQEFVSICGSARLLRDREKMHALWSLWVKPWFSQGVDDPDLGLLEVSVDQAEYWDAPASRMQRLLGLAQAMTTGNTDQLGEHGRVTPRDAPRSGR